MNATHKGVKSCCFVNIYFPSALQTTCLLLFKFYQSSFSAYKLRGRKIDSLLLQIRRSQVLAQEVMKQQNMFMCVCVFSSVRLFMNHCKKLFAVIFSTIINVDTCIYFSRNETEACHRRAESLIELFFFVERKF